MDIRPAWPPWRSEGEPPPARTPGTEPSEEAPTSESDLPARREEIARMEERALREIHSLELQKEDLERRSQAEELKRAKRVQRRELERISGLSASQARQLLMAEAEQEAKHQAGLRIRQI